jgi:hypothetical protein
MVADVTHLLISIDFLSHFGVLVDCKHNSLIGRHSRFLPSLKEHERYLWALFDQLQGYGIVINPAKCSELQRSLSSVPQCPPRVPNL